MNLKIFKNKKVHLKKKRFNPHHFWVLYLGVFLLIFIVELVFFSFYFLNVIKKLDTPASPTLESNATKIKRMQKNIDLVDEALKERVGEKTN